MPQDTYEIRDPKSGRTMTVRGSRPPSQAEAAALFKQSEPRSSVGDVAKRFFGTVAKDTGNLAMGLGRLVTTPPHQTAVDIAQAVSAGINSGNRAGLAEAITGAPITQIKRELAEGKYPEVAGHATAIVGSLALPKGVRALRGRFRAAGAPEPVPVAAPEPVAPKPTPPEGARLVSQPKVTVEQAMADALGELRQPSKPSSVSLPPQVELPPGYQPRTRAPQPPAPKKPKPETPAANTEPKAATKEMELPASWQQFVTPEQTATAVPENVPGVILKRTPKPEAVAAARRMLGARDAAPYFGITADEVRRIAPGPSRRPMAVELAEMDRDYARGLQNERGFINPRLAATTGAALGGAAIGGAAADNNPLAGALAGMLGGAALANPSKAARAFQTARVTGMLSGAAPLKSMAGNAGSFLTAAAERGDLAPIKEAFRIPTNARNALKGWKEGANPSGTGGMGAINIPGRLMGAMDEASTQALQRAGLTLEEAQRLLLTKPNPLGDEAGKVMNTPLGRALVPFQRTPFNSFFEGVKSINELLPGSGASNTRRALTLGAGAAGAAAGSETDHPLLLALLAALAGPRAIPFALGAGATAGPQVLERVGVSLPEGAFKDLLDPMRPIDKPAIMRLIETGGR